VAVLGKGGRNISVDRALDLVYGYTLGLDMTRRDLQRGLGDQKKALEIGKHSDAFELFPGDIIDADTPEKVRPVGRGDVIEMHTDGLPNLSAKFV